MAGSLWEKYESKKCSGIYRICDSLSNLKIRVCLWKVTSSTVVPSRSGGDGVREEEEGDDEGIELSAHPGAGARATPPHQQYEEATITWQQKIYSNREVQQEGRSSGRRRRIFTYTESEPEPPWFTSHQLSHLIHTSSPTTSAYEPDHYLADRLRAMQLVRGAGGHRERDPLTRSAAGLVQYASQKRVREAARAAPHQQQTMYIMADLSTHDDTDGGGGGVSDDVGDVEGLLCEHVLCELSVSLDGEWQQDGGVQGVLRVSPDLTISPRRPYRVDGGLRGVRGAGADVYEYTLDIVSTDTKLQQLHDTDLLHTQLQRRHSEYLRSAVGTEFHTPELGKLAVFYIGQIVSGQDFDTTHGGGALSLHYMLSLPHGWRVDDDSGSSSSVEGCSQTCHPSSEQHYMTHINYPLEFYLVYEHESHQISSGGRGGDSSGIPWPQLYVEVLSVDWWDCVRTLGYGYTPLPRTPGHHSLSMSTWRPYSGSAGCGELRRYFIGGAYDMEDLSYISTPQHKHQDNVLSKLGFSTCTTGTVNIDLNMCLQSQSLVKDAARVRIHRDATSLYDMLGGKEVQLSIAQVVEAFQRARERMIAVRNALKI